MEKNATKVVEENILPEFPKPFKWDIAKKRKQIYSFLDKYLDPIHLNGQFLVAKNGHVIYQKASGFANFGEQKEMFPTTPLHVASVSKVATSLAILRLVDQKKIILDEKVINHLPDFPYPEITIRMLLNHRSGVPYYGYFTHGIWNPKKTLRNKDILALLNKYKFSLNFVPGTKFAYCNTNYALLALIVEKVSGKKFPEAMKELIFEPLQMKNTFILDNPKMYGDVAPSYNSKHELQEFNYLDAIYGDKNMYTTALDLLQMDKGTYSAKFLSDSLHKQMFKGYSYEKPGKSNYGLGIRLKEMPGKDTYFFHSGWWHGNTACYASLRKDTICVIALSNVFTKNVYKINRLSAVFGNYPFEVEE